MQNGKQCPYCNKKLADSAYFKSFNAKHKDGLTPICKKCFAKNSMDNDGQGVDLARFQHMLQVCDKPYRPEIYNAALAQAGKNEGKTGFDFVKAMTGYYFAKLNLTQYKGLTWEDSTFTEGGNRKKAVCVDELFNEDHIPPLAQNAMRSLYILLDSYLEIKNEKEKNILASYVNNRIAAEMFAAVNDIAEYDDCKGFADDELIRLKQLRGTVDDVDFANEFQEAFATDCVWLRGTGGEKNE